MKKKIVIFDDEDRVGRGYAKNLQKMQEITSAFEVCTLDNKSFEKELDALENRRKSYRNKAIATGQTILDETSIFIIDYDLLKYPKSEYLTGENVAYLARGFSRCALIIGLNQYNRVGENIFDLKLKGHPESYCDLNISSTQICNPGLWGETRTRFRSWHWPQLINYVEFTERRIEEAKKHVDDPVVEVLGLKETFEEFPRSVSEFLGPNPEETTFRRFAQESGKGLRMKDLNDDEDNVAIIAQARIAKWLERLVLPGQDILVDAPHLVSRFPSLLKGDHKSKDLWNRTACFGKADSLPLHHEKIKNNSFKKDYWLSRPVWFWPCLCNSSTIDEVVAPWKREAADFLFCEDSSTFERREDCRQFRAEVDSVYVQRFVNLHPITGVDYQPQVRLL